MLSDSEDSDSGSLHHLTINEHYAKAFEYKKEREELEKLKQKYGSDFEEDNDDYNSESDVTEDEDGEELTPTVDAAILRTLARIVRKDPEIYNAEKHIFSEEHEKVAPTEKVSRALKDKSKPITIRQIALESTLNPHSRSTTPEPLPHVEEQRALRKETIAAFHHAVDNDDGDEFLVPREKTKDEQEKEEGQYHAFLEREVGRDLRELLTVVGGESNERDHGEVTADEGTEKKKKKKGTKGDALKVKVKVKSKEESDQDFLMNYILNRGWIDRSANHVPTYKEVTSMKKNGRARVSQEVSDTEPDSVLLDPQDGAFPTTDPDVDEDDFEEIVDRFESSYNFRFEEPDGAIIKSHPRNLSSLVRREDTTRKEARERRKQRKEEELLKKKEEIKRLKALKMREINTKLERIGKEGGKNLDNNSVLRELDLEGDWDPEAHDKQMTGLYEGDETIDDEKPHWNEDIDIGDILMSDAEKHSKKSKKKKKKEQREDDGVDVVAMDAEAEEIVDDEEWDGTEEMRKKRLDEYMDEIYGLDFNDIVGDMPTRFKYTSVAEQDFGLTPVEILLATDKELNEYMGVKKYAPYRRETKWDVKRRDKLKELKGQIAGRMTGESLAGTSWDGTSGQGRPVKKRKGKKERMKAKGASVEGAKDGGTDTETGVSGDILKRKRLTTDLDGGGVGTSEQASLGEKKRRRHKESELVQN